MRSTRQTMGLRGLKLHWGNARLHKSRETTGALQRAGLEIVPQPPYSLDLAPSGFFLFGYLKGRLRGKRSRDGDELLSCLRQEMEMIDQTILAHTFSEWERRLENVIESNGEYITKWDGRK